MAMRRLHAFFRLLRRKKLYSSEEFDYNNFKRCLNLWDLTSLGTGSTIGVGVYVIIGTVALRLAGPATVLSILIAAVISMLAGLCYAEFASRVPKLGSAYLYTYVTVGEMAAFIIGWNMILEGIFSTAVVAKSLSLYVDYLSNKTLSEFFLNIAPIEPYFLSNYFDLLSFLFVLIFGGVAAFGVRESMVVNNIFNVINICVIGFIVFSGAFKATPDLWSIPKESVPDGLFGEGGFMPYGVVGVLKGAAYCFLGFTSYDAIVNAAEEVITPSKTIPRAILLTQLVLLLGYIAVAVVVTMMIPYFHIEGTLDGIPIIFSSVGWGWARWIITVGIMFALLTSFYGCLYPVPRVMYAMSEDRLMPCFFMKLSNGRQSPVVGSVIVTVIVAILSGIFRLEELILVLTVGTLLSYTMVAICVVVLRYSSELSISTTSSYLRQMFGCGDRSPSWFTSRAAAISLTLFVITSAIFAIVTYFWWSVWAASLLGALGVIVLIMLLVQPRHDYKEGFMTPLVPLVPCISIACNIYLMVLLDAKTWIRVGIWTGIGVICYLIGLCIISKKKKNGYYDGKVNEGFTHEVNGKPAVQIVVEAPTPPLSIKREAVDENQNKPLSEEFIADIKNDNEPSTVMTYTEETIIQHSVIEHNEEKEAKIIDLLDQVIQAEEDTYGDSSSLSSKVVVAEEQIVNATEMTETMPHRKSLGELSETGSEISHDYAGIFQYDVVAQVHREDLPKVDEDNEDETKSDGEMVTFFNESETASRTDESGYSDTTDNHQLNASIEELKAPEPYIPPPPPLDESYFTSPQIRKSYTIAVRPKLEEKRRESIISNSSQDDVIEFGSARQQSFKNKLSGMLLKRPGKIAEDSDGELKRSNSYANVTDAMSDYRNRPSIFLDLNKEFMASDVTLRSVKPVEPIETENETENEVEESELNRADLKSKLENIFAHGGGTQLIRPRLVKAPPPATEEKSNADSVIERMPKVEKSNTLKLQKAKFNDVLNSFKMLARDDKV